MRLRGIDPGDLREPLEVQRKVRTEDGQGGWAEGWGQAWTVWARVRPLGSSERFTADQPDPRARYEITVRHAEDVRPKDRAVWGSKILEILGPALNTDESGGIKTLPAVHAEDVE